MARLRSRGEVRNNQRLRPRWLLEQFGMKAKERGLKDRAGTRTNLSADNTHKTAFAEAGADSKLETLLRN
jgi:hypothetical protein